MRTPSTSGATDCSPRKHAVRASGSSRSSSDACSEARGLEPSLFRGKSPVPYLSGVTRLLSWVGEESNPLCRKDGWITASCAPWRDRPCGAIGKWPRRRCSAVVKMLVSGLPMFDRKSGAYEQARKVSNPRPSVLETAAPPLARVQVNTRMTGCASTMRMRSERRSVSYQRTSVLPVFPASRPAACRSSSDRPGKHG